MKDLTMKKVLVIHNTGKYKGQSCFTSTIVGCDPNIGICLAIPGEEDAPWFIFDGPLSPNIAKCIWPADMALKVNEFCLEQLKSGYLSCYSLDAFIEELELRGTTNREGSECPYSM